jgi:VanZ family protein
MTGRLVIGTAPEGDDNWHGELRGLAIYSQELTAAQVSLHYATWTQNQRPEVSDREGLTALYLFNEHAGDTAHNFIKGGMDLIIPEKYSLLHEKFLEPFWEEYRPTQSYWIDILINVVGFIPLGLAYSAFWSFVRPNKHAVARTLMLGFAVSLTIEIIQSSLPTRSSGTTDLITNTLGTYLGVRVCGLGMVRNLVTRFCRGLSPCIVERSQSLL